MFAGAAYGYGLYKDRKDNSKINTVKLFKDQVDAMELKIKGQSEEIVNLAKEVHDLKEEIMEKDKKLSELLEILQGKDPAIANFISAFEKDISPILKRLEKYLDKQSF